MDSFYQEDTIAYSANPAYANLENMATNEYKPSRLCLKEKSSIETPN